MSRKGNCFGSSAIESYFSTLKAEYFHLERRVPMIGFKRACMITPTTTTRSASGSGCRGSVQWDVVCMIGGTVTVQLLGVRSVQSRDDSPCVGRQSDLREKMTMQTMDKVYLDGSEYWTAAEPLGCLPGLPVFMAFSTANQKGYDATWSIVADKLFLVALGGTTLNPSERGLAMVFPGCSAPVFADWFYGAMDIQNGRIVKPTDFNPLFENQITLTFSCGRVVAQESLQRKYVPGADLDPILFRPILEAYELTEPVIALLVAAGVHRLGDLVQMSPTALMRIRGFDLLAMERIEEGLGCFGFTVGMRLPGWPESPRSP